MSHKQVLLAAMEAGWTELMGVVKGNEGRLDSEMGDGWRVRDALAHVATWERMAARKIAGTPLPVGEELARRKPWTLDAFNEGMMALWRVRTEGEILGELIAAHEALVRAVERADEAACAPKGRVWRAIDEDGAGHYQFHFSVGDAMAKRRAQASGPNDS